MEEKVLVLNTIEQKPFQMSSVEIIIPFHDEHAKVLNLVNDIFATVATNRYLITLVDDGSANSSFVSQLKSKKIAGVRFLGHEKCKGFGAAVNTALKNPFNVNIPYVLIMHSDVRLHDLNWLFRLGTTLYNMKTKGVKMVTPLTNNPVADVPSLIGKHGEIGDDSVLSEGFIPMYCALAHRQLFQKVGLFMECPYAGTEVEEFAWRMRKNGFTQGVCGSSWVHHDGGATLEKFKNNKKVREILRKTRESVITTLKK
jgi:GT2 family glycosyltransferase